MAAADISGSLAGVRSTKRLLLVFTLLSLVYAAHSLQHTKNLEILTKYYQVGWKEAAKKKAQQEIGLAIFTESFQEQIDKLFSVVKQLKTITEGSPYLRELPTIMENVLDQKIQEVNDDIKAYRKEIQDVWAVIEREEDKWSEL
ncbi:hypothetical protein XENOCAPTIV_014236 [Xenoophorus captivus]|uniref:Uncharacterized protein n=1 Tax=Xenoophorus captivus TaxID=1517983 RepID=A0ABV0S7I4_9TELE